jgi:hypothetical protein
VIQIALWGVLALALMGGIGYGVSKIKDWGREEVRAEVAERDKKAQEAADAERKRQDALRQKEDKQATKRLQDAQKRAKALQSSLEAQIRAAGAAAQCPVPDGMRDAWNASHTREGNGSGAMPGLRIKPAAPDRPKLGGGG